MKKVQLGSSDLSVSEVCLGSMTWGNQNSQEDAFEQIDYALSEGINFIDTAEMYAVPPNPDTCGLTETYIGNWLEKNAEKRKDLILATKVAGPGLSWVRDGSAVTGASVKEALEGSLKRLKTDYIDLYQIHWANRPSPHFGKHWPEAVSPQDIDSNEQKDGMLDILSALGELQQQGKIRHCGLSDETPWGISQYLSLAKENSLPRMVSIQNEFSLLHMKDSPYVIEACVLENVAYLPWSPMAGGALSGKYRQGARPENTRWGMAQRHGNFRDTAQSNEAIEAYHQIATKHGLSLAALSLAWVYQFKGVTSTIIGATSMDNLKENIHAYSLTLSDETLSDIQTAIKNYPLPF